MYGVEWLIGYAVLALAAGLGVGYLLASRGASGDKRRELEEQVAAARRELEDYRHEVVTQFSETARKFQTLNDSYTDLHQQLAKSSSILCGEVSGPLLAAPAGHQDLIPAEIRDPGPNLDAERSEDGAGIGAQPDPDTAGVSSELSAEREPEEDRDLEIAPTGMEDGEAIRVAEPEDSSADGEAPTASDPVVESSRKVAGRS